MIRIFYFGLAASIESCQIITLLIEKDRSMDICLFSFDRALVHLIFQVIKLGL